MKTVYKFLMFGAMALTLTAVSVTANFAQDDAAAAAAAQEAKTALYTKFTDCWTKDLKPTEKVGTGGDKAAIDACLLVGKDYLDKYEKDSDQYGKFVRGKYDLNVKGRASSALAARFNNSFKDKKVSNVDEAFVSGKDLVSQNPDLIDVPITLASIGYDNAAAATPNDKYNADAVNYAKMVISKIEAGKTSDQYGAYNYAYTTKNYPDGKNNTLGYMNYYIGYIMYYRQNMKKEALPYFYKATQLNSAIKADFRLFGTIGSYYADEFKRLDAERVTKVKAAGDQDTDETKPLFAMQKGYAERAADAYARAAKLAAADTTATKEQKDGLLGVAKQFYGIRYNNDATKFEGYDAFSAGLTNKPLINPSTAVTPVVEATPATTGTPASGTTPATTATPSATKPPMTTMPATTTKPSTTAAPSTTTTPSTTKPSTTTRPSTTATPAKPPAATTSKTLPAKKKTSR